MARFDLRSIARRPEGAATNQPGATPWESLADRCFRISSRHLMPRLGVFEVLAQRGVQAVAQAQQLDRVQASAWSTPCSIWIRQAPHSVAPISMSASRSRLISPRPARSEVQKRSRASP